MIDKDKMPTKLLWVDLEMTGLDPNEDLILEIAAIITDFDFKPLAQYETIVKQPKDIVNDRMDKNTWWAQYPENRQDFLDKLDEGKDPSQVEAELLTLINTHFGDEPPVLAGNSIHNDRGFIRNYWPNLDNKLHYRMLDVSSFKVLMQGKFDLRFEKKEVHRAFDDIEASIAEIQYYLNWFRDHS